MTCASAYWVFVNRSETKLSGFAELWIPHVFWDFSVVNQTEDKQTKYDNFAKLSDTSGLLSSRTIRSRWCQQEIPLQYWICLLKTWNPRMCASSLWSEPEELMGGMAFLTHCHATRKSSTATCTRQPITRSHCQKSLSNPINPIRPAVADASCCRTLPISAPRSTPRMSSEKETSQQY